MQKSSLGVEFREVDLDSVISCSVISYLVARSAGHVITMFATLHHIPSTEMRLDILRTVRKLIERRWEIYFVQLAILEQRKTQVTDSALGQSWD